MPPIFSNHKGKWITACIIILILTFLPNAAQYAIKSSLQKQGLDQVSIDNVDINLFSGTASVEHLEIVDQHEQKLNLGQLNFEYNWRGLFSGGVTIEQIELKDTFLRVQQDSNGDLEVVLPIGAGEKPEETTEKPKEAGVALPKIDAESIKLTNINVEIDVPVYQGKVFVKQLFLNKATTWQNQQTTLLVDALVDEAPVKVNLTAQLFDEQPHLSGQINVDKLDLTDYQNLIGDDLRLESALFSTDINFSGNKSADGSVSANIDLQVGVEQFKSTFAPFTNAVDALQLSIKGDVALIDAQPIVDVTLNGAINELTVTQQGSFDLALEKLTIAEGSKLQRHKNTEGQYDANINTVLILDKLNLGYQPLVNSIERWSLDLLGDVKSVDNNNQINVQLNTGMDNVLVKDAVQDYVLFATQRLDISNTQLNEQLIAQIEQIVLSKVSFNHTDEQPKGVLLFDALNVEQVDFINANDTSAANLDIKKIHITKLIDTIHLGNEYQLLGFEQVQNTVAQLTKSSAGAQSEDPQLAESEDPQLAESDTSPESLQDEHSINEPVAQQSTPMLISIEEFSVQQGSEIILAKDFGENTIDRHYDIEALQVTNIKVGDETNRSNFVFKVKPDEFSLIDIEGDGKFFASPLELNVKGHLDAMSLVKLSPFAEPVIGYQLQNGQMDHQFTLGLKDNQMDMKNNLVVRKLKFKEIESHEQNAEHASGLPIGMAIGLLEDSDGKIELDVPIKSDLNNTEVGLGDVIRTSLGKVVQKSSLSLLKYSLQPFGAILMASELVVDQVNSIHFQPLLFAVNSSVPVAEQSEYPQKLALLLLDKEDLSVNLCGFSNAEDKTALELSRAQQVEQTALSATQVAETPSNEDKGDTEPLPSIDEALNTLAQARGHYLKSFLIEQGIASKRLYLCKPQYKDDAIMGVEIGM